MPLDENRFIPPAGANYVIAQRIDGGRTIVMAGETDNLAVRSWRNHLDVARERYGDVEILTRLNVTSAIRREELADMIDGYNPPMNGGEPRSKAGPQGESSAA
jgi:hypothetical protein